MLTLGRKGEARSRIMFAVEDDDLPRLPHGDCVARRIPDLVVALTALLNGFATTHERYARSNWTRCSRGAVTIVNVNNASPNLAKRCRPTGARN